MHNTITPALIATAMAAVEGMNTADPEVNKAKWRAQNGGELPSKKMEKDLEHVHNLRVQDMGDIGKIAFREDVNGGVEYIAIDNPNARAEFNGETFEVSDGTFRHSIELPTRRKIPGHVADNHIHPSFADIDTHLYLPKNSNIEVDFTGVNTRNTLLNNSIYPHGHLNAVFDLRNDLKGKDKEYGCTATHIVATQDGSLCLIGDPAIFTNSFGIIPRDGVPDLNIPPETDMSFYGNVLNGQNCMSLIKSVYSRDPITGEKIESPSHYMPVSVQVRTQNGTSPVIELQDEHGKLAQPVKEFRKEIDEEIANLRPKRPTKSEQEKGR